MNELLKAVDQPPAVERVGILAWLERAADGSARLGLGTACANASVEITPDQARGLASVLLDYADGRASPAPALCIEEAI